ncbi:MAG: allantoinase PuuE [Maritimibacter sp.]
MARYPRNMRGYGRNTPDPKWPGGARIAVQFVVNYEEGGENCLLHGDEASEAFLSEIVGAAQWPGQRHWNMESIYEYGARSGFWRVFRLFQKAGIKPTVYGVATALARSPEQLAAMQEAGWEVASHGLKWVEHKDMPAEEERAAIAEAIRLHTEVTGAAPRGWYTGRCSMNTVHLAAETGEFDYISDTYDDDLPYWLRVGARDQLIIPYTLDANDMRFATPQGFNTADHFFTYLRDAFDALYEEGLEGAPKMMSIGLHNRLIGRPGRIAGLKRFIDYAMGHEGVWFPRRIDIAEHWKTHHAPVAQIEPFALSKAEFLQEFAGIFEHSPWIAEAAFELELGPAHSSAIGMHNALCRVFRSAPEAKKREVLLAHPDLAGKLAAAEKLTADSTSEQASAGLDALTDAERESFTRLNSAYREKHGFPFIIAARDHDKAGILAAFERRLAHDSAAEFAEACAQVERIALLRLQEKLP